MDNITDEKVALEDLVIESESEVESMTKGEALVCGLNQIDEGLRMVSSLGNRYDLIATMVGSKTSARRLRDVIKNNRVLYNLVLNMVAAKNSRLSMDTVGKIVSDFMDTLFDLSQPYRSG